MSCCPEAPLSSVCSGGSAASRGDALARYQCGEPLILAKLFSSCLDGRRSLRGRFLGGWRTYGGKPGCTWQHGHGGSCWTAPMGDMSQQSTGMCSHPASWWQQQLGEKPWLQRKASEPLPFLPVMICSQLSHGQKEI